MTDHLTNEWGNGVRIAAVETAVIEGNFDWILVRVTTDDGSSGLGEAYWGAGVLELIKAASAFIISKNPFDVARIIFELQRCLSGAGSQAGATVTTISGIELALWDLVARALDTPLSTLFGGRFRDRIRLYVDLHAGEEPTPESWAIRARDALARGFSAVKFDIDAPNPYRASSAENTDPWRLWYEPYNRTMSAAERRFIVDVVSAVRAAIGPDIDLALDCHWKYAVPDAIALAHALEPLLPVWLEDPVPPDNVDALRAVARSTRIPICTGENHYRLAGFRELILRQACQFVAHDIPKWAASSRPATSLHWLNSMGCSSSHTTSRVPSARWQPHNSARPYPTSSRSSFMLSISHGGRNSFSNDHSSKTVTSSSPIALGMV
ncbi:putative isomerase [Thermomicrobium roseum DSM 5159]|uniref:Putative isomerase n=1 Tax=Thermomicrobium roseum (strain ATCC 27502 / DSM 5159 / P-2) TaxID=309801 RepID=B9KZI9_THERP|nr:putative isomerase [Thermomicrobium roseum DSM 5159]